MSRPGAASLPGDPSDATLAAMTAAAPEILRRFVVLEGGDGAGTTTQLKIIDKALTLANKPAVIMMYVEKSGRIGDPLQ